jgi:hypothetical protein
VVQAINQQTAGRCKRCGGDDCNSLSNVLTAARVNGLCAITACRTGFADCDKSAANGCEVGMFYTARLCPLQLHTLAWSRGADCHEREFALGFGVARLTWRCIPAC